LNTFSYTRPESFDEVLDLLYEHGPDARLLAGGTDLLVRIRKGHMAPRLVIDIKKVARLRGDIQEIGQETGVSLRVGALTVMADLLADPRIQHHFPALAEAASTVGSVQIRNRATLSGNICNASPAADTVPALLVYEALVNIAGKSGCRRVLVKDFFLNPGKTVLQRGELVESIDLPVPDSRSAAAFSRLTRRRGVDLATVSVCCRVKSSGQTLFGFGAVGPRPILVSDESGRLGKANLSEAERGEIFRTLVQPATPISDVRGSREYRLAMLIVLCRRTLQLSLARLASSVTKE